MRKGVSSLALGLVLVGLSWAMQSSAETLTKLKPLSDPALEALLKQQLEPEERVQLPIVLSYRRWQAVNPLAIAKSSIHSVTPASIKWVKRR